MFTLLHTSAIHVQHVYSFGLQGPFLYVSVDYNKVQCTLNVLMCNMIVICDVKWNSIVPHEFLIAASLTLNKALAKGSQHVKFEPTTPNMSQHNATGWSNARIKLHPTMLRYVMFKCCDCLAGACKAGPTMMGRLERKCYDRLARA